MSTTIALNPDLVVVMTKTKLRTTKTQSPYKRRSIQTSAFGPPLWSYLHMWALSFPLKPSKADKVLFASTFLNIMQTLPCPLCVANAKKHLECLKFAQPHTTRRLSCTRFFSSRPNLCKFVFDFHNLVNKCLGKSVHKDYQTFVSNMQVVYAGTQNDNHIKCRTCVTLHT